MLNIHLMGHASVQIMAPHLCSIIQLWLAVVLISETAYLSIIEEGGHLLVNGNSVCRVMVAVFNVMCN